MIITKSCELWYLTKNLFQPDPVVEEEEEEVVEDLDEEEVEVVEEDVSPWEVMEEMVVAGEDGAMEEAEAEVVSTLELSKYPSNHLANS